MALFLRSSLDIPQLSIRIARLLSASLFLSVPLTRYRNAIERVKEEATASWNEQRIVAFESRDLKSSIEVVTIVIVSFSSQ